MMLQKASSYVFASNFCTICYYYFASKGWRWQRKFNAKVYAHFTHLGGFPLTGGFIALMWLTWMPESYYNLSG